MFSCIVGHNLMTEQQQQMWKINKLVCILWFQYVKSGHSEKKNHFKNVKAVVVITVWFESYTWQAFRVKVWIYFVSYGTQGIR